MSWQRLALIEPKSSTTYPDINAFQKAVQKGMLEGSTRCASRSELQKDNGCVYFEIKKSPKIWKGPTGTWRTHIALARDDRGATGDTCFPRRWYLTHRSADSSSIQAVWLTRLQNNEICGSGGWGDWSSAGAAHHDAPTGLLTLIYSGGAVFKTGSSALAEGNSMASHKTDIRFVCAPAAKRKRFACLSQRFETQRVDKASSQRGGYTPKISFKNAKAVLTSAAYQFTYPEYEQLKGMSFPEVLEHLPEIRQAIQKRLKISPSTP